MEHVDSAFERFSSIVEGELPQYKGTIVSEADVQRS